MALGSARQQGWVVGRRWPGVERPRGHPRRACKDVASTNSLSKIVGKKKEASSGALSRLSSDRLKDDFADRQAAMEVGGRAGGVVLQLTSAWGSRQAGSVVGAGGAGSAARPLV